MAPQQLSNGLVPPHALRPDRRIDSVRLMAPVVLHSSPKQGSSEGADQVIARSQIRPMGLSSSVSCPVNERAFAQTEDGPAPFGLVLRTSGRAVVSFLHRPI